MNTLRGKSKKLFYLIMTIGVVSIGFVLYFFGFLFKKIIIVWQSLIGKLETICGCANHFVFANHPYLFSFLILSFLIISLFIFVIAFKMYKIRKTTKDFVESSLKYQRSTMSKRLEKVVTKIKLGTKVLELKKNELNVFCYGFLKPKILISTEFINNLGDEELEAVLLHEQHHLLSRDPLKFYLVKIINHVLFFVPFLSVLSNRFFTISEMAADDWAVEKMNGKIHLAKAVAKSLEWRERMVSKNSLVVPLFDDITEERINKIIDDKYVIDLKILTARLAMFFLVFVISLSVYTFLVFSGQGVIAMHDENYCLEQGTESSSCSMNQEGSSCKMETKEEELGNQICGE